MHVGVSFTQHFCRWAGFKVPLRLCTGQTRLQQELAKYICTCCHDSATYSAVCSYSVASPIVGVCGVVGVVSGGADVRIERRIDATHISTSYLLILSSSFICGKHGFAIYFETTIFNP
jgi:hypothetical protein